MRFYLRIFVRLLYIKTARSWNPRSAPKNQHQGEESNHAKVWRGWISRGYKANADYSIAQVLILILLIHLGVLS
jgi:hypothetical protein